MSIALAWGMFSEWIYCNLFHDFDDSHQTCARPKFMQKQLKRLCRPHEENHENDRSALHRCLAQVHLLINRNYLGVKQMDVELPKDHIEKRGEFVRTVLATAESSPESTESTKRGEESVSNPSSLRAERKPPRDRQPIPAIRAWQYSMKGHAEQCVERYLDLANTDIDSLKTVSTPCIDDHMFSPEDFTSKGEAASVAARIVLKALYLARTNRPDTLWSVCSLARNVTKWTTACDKRLLRLMSYLNCTKDRVTTNYVGDPISECKIHLFVDASFAGDLVDSKSTSGAIVVLVGPNTWVPITWLCKKQGAVSHSSSEAEIIALEAALRAEGIPALMLWDFVVEVFHPQKGARETNAANVGESSVQAFQQRASIIDHLIDIDSIPNGLHDPKCLSELVILEDNEACLLYTSPSPRDRG